MRGCVSGRNLTEASSVPWYAWASRPGLEVSPAVMWFECHGLCHYFTPHVLSLPAGSSLQERVTTGDFNHVRRGSSLVVYIAISTSCVIVVWCPWCWCVQDTFVEVVFYEAETATLTMLTNSDTADTVVENSLEGIPVTLMTNVE